MLTDEEILAAFASSDGTFVSSGRAVITACEAKLREQNEPVAWADETGYVWPNDDKHIKSNIPLYLNPAPIPEGWQLVPIDLLKKVDDYLNGPTAWKVKEEDELKAMLAAARSGE